MSENSPKLGIVAGQGPLPVELAMAAQAAGRDVFILAIDERAHKDVALFPHAHVAIGAHGQFLRLLKENGCKELVLIGRIERPDLSKLKLDMAGIKLLPKLARWLARGDDGLLRGISDYLQKEHGFRIIGAHEVLSALLTSEGVLTRTKPSEADEKDIDAAIRATLAIGALDIGQGAVACREIILALEAAEGTDLMLARVASLRPEIRGSEERREGVLVKLSKPGQEKRLDMPTIGVETVRNASAAGLAGIAAEADGTLMVDREAVIREADERGMFILGLELQRIEKAVRK